jgi:flagellar biosynthesis protein FlgN
MSISMLFKQDTQLLNDLVSLLSKEQAALVNMDIDEVESILDQKSKLIQTIANATKMRHKALAQAGYDANENGMVMWLRANDSKLLQAQWDAFQKQLSQAKELNRVNGQVINQHFQRNQQIISQLQGKAVNAGAGNVYGPNGQTTFSSHTRSMLSV